MKKIALLLYLLSSVAFAEDSHNDQRNGPPGGHGPRLTQEQRNCIDSQLGGAPHEVNATMNQMQAAASSCGVEFSAPPRNSDTNENMPEPPSDS